MENFISSLTKIVLALILFTFFSCNKQPRISEFNPVSRDYLGGGVETYKIKIDSSEYIIAVYNGTSIAITKHK